MVFLAWANLTIPFICAYGVAGVNDVLDGFLARRFHWESKLGAKFDSIGDIVFLVCAIAACFWALELHLKPYIYVGVGVIVAIRLANMIFTRVKFKQFGFIHNNAVRWCSVPIYFIIPVSVLNGGKVPNPFLMGCLCLVVLASLEETWILGIMEDYDMNMKSIYHMKKHKRKCARMITQAKEEKETITV